jgi:hypothetical protein
VVAAGLLAVTAGVYLGLTMPLRAKAAAAADAYARARDERRAAQARLGEIRRRESALRRAAPKGSPALSRDPVGHTRQGIVAALAGTGLSGVRLGVRPASAPAVAQVRLAAEGPFAEVVRLTGDLVRPGTGVVLETFHLTGRDSRLAVRLEGVGLGAMP